VQVRVLGPTEVTRDEHPVDLGTRKQRALVAALVLHGGRAVGVDTLVDLLWGDAPPASVGGTLHAYVAGLRRALEPDRPPRAAATLLVTVDGGYALRLPADAVDARRFDDGVTQVHRRLHAGRGPDEPPGVPVELTAAELAALDDRLSVLLDDWHGTPYAELDDAAAATAERSRLAELRLLALEDRALVRMVLGQSSTVVGELEQLTASTRCGRACGDCGSPPSPTPAVRLTRWRRCARSAARCRRSWASTPVRHCSGSRRRCCGRSASCDRRAPARRRPLGPAGRPAPRSIGRDDELQALEHCCPGPRRAAAARRARGERPASARAGSPRPSRSGQPRPGSPS
jgi:hypothetical protein